MVIIITKD